MFWSEWIINSMLCVTITGCFVMGMRTLALQQQHTQVQWDALILALQARNQCYQDSQPIISPPHFKISIHKTPQCNIQVSHQHHTILQWRFNNET